MPQPIGLFLFCIEFGWGRTKLIIVLCSNLLVEVEISWQTEFGRVWLKKKLFGCFLGGDPLFLHESFSWVEIRLHTEFGRVWLCRS